MANEYQEALLAAMEVVAGNTIDHLATDKTVTATIVASTNALTGEYRVSYNANYNEYTVRSKKSGRVYFATNDSNEAYAELNRLNNGGSRGPELHKQGMIF